MKVKSFSLVVTMLILFQMAIPATFSANELTKRSEVPSIENYPVEVQSSQDEILTEAFKAIETDAKQEFESQKQARAFSYKTINSLIKIAVKTTTEDNCNNLSGSYICSVTTDEDGLSTFTFEYKTKYKNANFKVITTVNAAGQLESQSRFAYGEHKYDVFYDSETNEISRVIFYVNGLNTLEWTFSEGEIVHTIQYIYNDNGDLEVYIEAGENGLWLEVIFYYANGQIEERTVYDEFEHVQLIEGYYENGFLKFYEEYLTLYDYEHGTDETFLINLTVFTEEGAYLETYSADSSDGSPIQHIYYNEQGNEYIIYDFHPNLSVLSTFTMFHDNGNIHIKEYYNTEEIPTLSYQYSYVGNIQSSYTYYASGRGKSEILYDDSGKLVQYSTFYENGKTSSVSHYKSGTLSTKVDYLNNGSKAKYTSYHANGKVKTIVTFDQGVETSSTTYDVSGNKTGSSTYKDGKKTFSYNYTSSGIVVVKIKYNSEEDIIKKWTYNSKTGIVTNYTTYHANGKVNMVNTYYANGNLKSKTIYDEDGNKTSSQTY